MSDGSWLRVEYGKSHWKMVESGIVNGEVGPIDEQNP